MNERIAALANQAGFDVDKSGTFGNYAVMHRLEKFAELLEQECQTKYFNAGYNLGREEGMSKTVADCIKLALEAADMDAQYEAWYLIKQHFGVE